MRRFRRLEKIIDSAPPMAVAVSGGVDSLTLALFIAGLRTDCVIFHAISPAVPQRATERVRRIASTEEWELREIVAGEFDDKNYLSNPYNRCFYCKMNLYQEIAKYTELTIVSGTNFDDLSDFRPGLTAAENHNVRHPYVEAELRKSDVRALARNLGATDVAELPASPCLSSRIETGIAIDADTLVSVNIVEEWLANRYLTNTVRCRVLGESVRIEVDETCLHRLSDADKQTIRERVKAKFAEAGISMAAVDVSSYRMGSAFVADAAQT